MKPGVALSRMFVSKGRRKNDLPTGNPHMPDPPSASNPKDFKGLVGLVKLKAKCLPFAPRS